LASAFGKESGGFLYISKETNQVLIGHDLSDRAASKSEFAGVPCRALSKVSPDRQPSCVSLIDAERPGWYLTHRDGFLYFEPEYAPRNRDTFDDDASFFIRVGQFCPGCRTLESVSLPGYYIHSTADDKLALSPLQNTSEFQTAGNAYNIHHSHKGESNVRLSLHF